MYFATYTDPTEEWDYETGETDERENFEFDYSDEFEC